MILFFNNQLGYFVALAFLFFFHFSIFFLYNLMISRREFCCSPSLRVVILNENIREKIVKTTERS